MVLCSTLFGGLLLCCDKVCILVFLSIEIIKMQRWYELGSLPDVLGVASGVVVGSSVLCNSVWSGRCICLVQVWSMWRSFDPSVCWCGSGLGRNGVLPGSCSFVHLFVIVQLQDKSSALSVSGLCNKWSARTVKNLLLPC